MSSRTRDDKCGISETVRHLLEPPDTDKYDTSLGIVVDDLLEVDFASASPIDLALGTGTDDRD